MALTAFKVMSGATAIWSLMMIAASQRDAAPLADAAVQMINTSVVRVHQHGACIADNNHQGIGRSRGA